MYVYLVDPKQIAVLAIAACPDGQSSAAMAYRLGLLNCLSVSSRYDSVETDIGKQAADLVNKNPSLNKWDAVMCFSSARLVGMAHNYAYQASEYQEFRHSDERFRLDELVKELKAMPNFTESDGWGWYDADDAAWDLMTSGQFTKESIMKFQVTQVWGNPGYGMVLDLGDGAQVNWSGPGWYARAGDVYYHVPSVTGDMPDTTSMGLGTPVWADGFAMVKPVKPLTLQEINPDMDGDELEFWSRD